MKSLATITKIACIIFLATGISRSDEWYDMQMGKMNNINSLSDAQKIETLGKIAAIGNKENLQEEEIAVLERAQSMLTAIPGHAKYFQEKLRKMAANEQATEKQESLPYPDVRDFSDRDRRWIFDSLAYIPSIENVELLGESLSDNHGGMTDEEINEALNEGGHDAGFPSANSLYAAKSLGRLIDRPPIQKNWESYNQDDVEVWKLWYAQVKAGTKTFRYKGDPQEYSLKGPVTTPATAARERNPEATTTSPDTTAPGSRWPMIATAAACAILAAAGWLLLKNRQRA